MIISITINIIKLYSYQSWW